MEIYKAKTGCIVYIDPDEETMDRFDKVAQGCRAFLSNHARVARTRTAAEPAPDAAHTPVPAPDRRDDSNT